ncbi:GDP dissociation inhibitor-domain-containing protein [Halteromyces radiatus]|uniref:GDP dissociation inhibitor-domain-containing protein n=1 Tax=Halteromyces radiatus TaxID=101107 RepID=UPI00221F1938|nr:GDP dissociation inhibitor-domain-containing protein [Halteromyces radiatus]KAI8092542.1 GDP dissociation inhibitor-domain-containing protein [Halteromyces radiatus]
MNDQLEDTAFDVIVIGTGLVESIVAGSLARSGKKVLHLDSNKQYGSNWGVFNIKNLLDWEQQLKTDTTDKDKDHKKNYIDYYTSYANNFKDVELLFGKQVVEVDEELEKPLAVLDLSTKEHPLDGDATLEAIKKALTALLIIPDTISSTDIQTYIQPMTNNYASILLNDENNAKTGRYELQDVIFKLKTLIDFLVLSRHYNLDTVPKILPSRGDLVEILIRSGVGRYMEFKSVDDMFIFDHTKRRMEKVPGSKEDVFVNKSISLPDKRKLMKFLKYAMDDDRDLELLKDYETMTYAEFLQDRFKITGNLQNAVVHAISLSRSDVNAKQGFERTQAFMKSIGRFGKGAYLCTLYGGGSEISQAFCRICAVYGGVYILGQSLERYDIDEQTGECTGVVTKDGQIFTAPHIITGLDYLSPDWRASSTTDKSSWVSRAMIITNRSPAQFSKEDSSNQSLGASVIPPNDCLGNKNELVYILNQSSETMACPKDQFVTYLWTLEDSNGQQVLKQAAQLLLERESENNDMDHESTHVLLELHYKQRIRSSQTIQEEWNIPKNVYICSDPDASIDFEEATKEAKTIFYKCVPEETEFMPPAEEVEGDDY